MKKTKTKTKKDNTYVVNELGSLGLLAIGYQGLRAWRKKREEVLKAKDEQEKK